MSRIKRAAAILMILLLAAGLAPVSFSEGAPQGVVSIIFTGDMHTRFDPERFVAEDGQIAERGGFARLKTAIDGVLSQHPDSLILDAGDFSMGTPYQTVFSSEAPELRLMGRMGFDAAVLGNHEFDYRAPGLADMLNAAAGSGERLPSIVIANIDWEGTLADERLAGDAANLRAAMTRYGVADGYLTLMGKGGVRAAVFGLMGNQAVSNAPESGVYFKDPIETAKEIVAQIKADGNADIIICLSHGRLNDNPRRSEDELLAAAVPEIDVIVSGHSHTRLEQPIVIGNTVIVASGEHAYDVGHVTLAQDGGRFRVEDYRLIPVRGNLPGDGEIEAAILAFRELVDSQYLSQFGYSFEQTLAYSPFAFTPIERFSDKQGEDTLGSLIADSYVAAVKRAEGNRYRAVDVAIAPKGVVRASFAPGEITVADAFNVSSLGIGPDRIPGYPLVSVYLTGRELKTVAEVDISISPLMPPARLYMSGLTYTYNPHRLPLNRVTSVQLMDMDGNVSELDNNRLYRVVSGLYSTQMLGEVESQSFGLLKVTPKDENGVPIVNFEDHIIYDGGVELKEWVALARYLESFPQTDGLPRIPEYYNVLQGRKVEETGRSPAALLKSPNKFFFLLTGAFLLVLAILTLPVWLIVRAKRRRKRRRSSR